MEATSCRSEEDHVKSVVPCCVVVVGVTRSRLSVADVLMILGCNLNKLLSSFAPPAIQIRVRVCFSPFVL